MVIPLMVTGAKIFVTLFTAYVAVILSMTAYSVYLLLRILWDGDYILPESELFRKTKETTEKVKHESWNPKIWPATETQS